MRFLTFDMQYYYIADPLVVLQIIWAKGPVQRH
jgi:hypothetical protein